MLNPRPEAGVLNFRREPRLKVVKSKGSMPDPLNADFTVKTWHVPPCTTSIAADILRLIEISHRREAFTAVLPDG